MQGYLEIFINLNYLHFRGLIIQDVKEVVYLKSKDGGDNSMPLKGF